MIFLSFFILIMSMLDISGLDAAPLENVRFRLRKTVPAGRFSPS